MKRLSVQSRQMPLEHPVEDLLDEALPSLLLGLDPLGLASVHLVELTSTRSEVHGATRKRESVGVGKAEAEDEKETNSRVTQVDIEKNDFLSGLRRPPKSFHPTMQPKKIATLM